MLSTLLVPILLLASSAASAASWAVFAECGEPGQQRLYSYDAASVKRSGKQLIVPVRADYSRLQGSRAQNGRLTWAVDCGGRTLVERSRTEYSSSGEVVWRRKRPTGSMDFNPGSVGAKL